MQLNTGQWVVTILAAILILGFILGYYTNRQRAEKTFRWIREGLSTLGNVTVGDKLPGMVTGGRLEVNQPTPPLKRVETVYLLAPRDNLLFWLFHLLQGRSDELIIWYTYQNKPAQSVEIARRGDRQFTKRLTDKDKPALSVLENIDGLQVAVEAKPGARLPEKVQSFLSKYKSYCTRLAIRPEKPHLYLRVNLKIMTHYSAGDLFSILKEFGE